jgi:hypothetical protein
MKKVQLTNAKLRLNRETLRALEQSDLVAVNGGVITTVSCDLGSCNTCNTRGTCTTRFC